MQVEVYVFLVVQGEQEVFLCLRIFSVNGMKQFLDVLSFGVAVVWTAGLYDRDLQFAADFGNIRFKGETERPYECRLRVGKKHLGIKGGYPSAVDHIQKHCFDRIIAMMGKRYLVAAKFLGFFDDGAFFEGRTYRTGDLSFMLIQFQDLSDPGLFIMDLDGISAEPFLERGDIFLAEIKIDMDAYKIKSLVIGILKQEFVQIKHI